MGQKNKPMGWKVLKKTNFYNSFCEKRSVPSCYFEIHTRYNPDPIYHNSTIAALDLSIGTYIIELFPSYLTFQVNRHYRRKLKKIFRVKGYSITIDQLEHVDQYLGTHFKPNFRTSMRRRLKGLETCFDVNYRMFYGNMVREDYDFIMEGLQRMLIRRFDQRNDNNVSLNRWEELYNNTFALINAQKASLFVIYDGPKPIQISLSYHFDKIMFLSIPSYDIDYSKFGLGNISVQKLLDWCIENSYKILDMGYGAFDYKVKWCNEIYEFEHHVFYDKSSVISTSLMRFATLKTQLINFLIANKVNIHYHRIKSIFIGKKKSDQAAYRIEKIDFDIAELWNYKKVYPLIDESYAFLRKSIFDFLYTHLEHRKNVQVFELVGMKSYVVKGAHQAQKISFDCK